jgi:site-specific DNA-methyltransferase (adenine-specific)
MGSGTTAQVCIEEGRNFIGFEIDNTYHQMCLDKISSCGTNLLTACNAYDDS